MHISYCVYTHLGNVGLTNCLCGIAQMHVWYCVVHTLKQHQADGWLLWELPGVCFVICFDPLKQCQANETHYIKQFTVY